MKGKIDSRICLFNVAHFGRYFVSATSRWRCTNIHQNPLPL